MSSQAIGPAANAAPPTVSIVVRSMGRPELRRALESIAAQDYPSIEAIVVDATGGRHPALPNLRWKPGHTLRIVTRDVRLPRPMAANVGLESVTGEWFSFLDDDDTCEPDHVSTLVAATQAHPDTLVIYGCGRLFDADGRRQQVFGRPFNRALMHYGPLFYWQASLISTRARELGCRFDPALAVCEDRDFLAQIAQYGDFVFLPSAATFNYRPDLGTSGTGQGANRDTARIARFENLLRAKWAGPGVLHNERAARRCREGVRAYAAGDLLSARRWFEDALGEYPDDPNALHGLAGVALAEGRRDDARAYVRRAIEINPQAAEYYTTLAEVDGRAAAAVTMSPRAPRAPSRNALCPCGSGMRYKACHGRLESAAAASAPTDTPRDPAREEIDRGNAYAARARLREATAASNASREHLLATARLELDLGDATAAFPLLERGAAIRVDREAGLMLEECCAALVRDIRDRSLWATIDELTATRVEMPAEGRVAIVVPASQKAAIEQASLLRDALGARAEMILATPGHSVDVAHPAATLVLFDPDLELAVPHGAPPARIVVRMNRDDPEALVRALARLRDTHPGAWLQYTRPFDDAGASAAKPMPIEYPWIDPSLSGRGSPQPLEDDAVTIGRAYGADDHPNDPALYRRLIAGGTRLTVPATPFLERAFRDDPLQSRPAFLKGDAPPLPDIVLLRVRAARRGRADADILEALAAARSVVVFADTIGAREWIEHGRSGFIVATEEEAEACVARLARDPDLRRDVGFAARAAAVRTLDAQRARSRAFYLGVSVIE